MAFIKSGVLEAITKALKGKDELLFLAYERESERFLNIFFQTINSEKKVSGATDETFLDRFSLVSAALISFNAHLEQDPEIEYF